MALVIKIINKPDDLIKIFKLRIEVFTFEQNCQSKKNLITKTILIQIVINLLLKKMVSALVLQEYLITQKIKLKLKGFA